MKNSSIDLALCYRKCANRCSAVYSSDLLDLFVIGDIVLTTELLIKEETKYQVTLCHALSRNIF